jgi:hypothetical protein
MLATSLVFKVMFLYDPYNSCSNRYSQFFTTVYNVTVCPSTGYVVTLHGGDSYITVVRQ